jgi:hypothetical protein
MICHTLKFDDPFLVDKIRLLKKDEVSFAIDFSKSNFSNRDCLNFYVKIL